MQSPRVSIIIPTYNRAALLTQAIESALAKTHPVEVLVVDDGSTDETQKVVAQFGNAVKYYWKENSGAGGARNLGIEKAQGEYFIFLDDDDLLLPTAVARLLKLLCSTAQAGMAYSDLFVMNVEGETYGRYFACEGFVPFSGDLYSCYSFKKLHSSSRGPVA